MTFVAGQKGQMAWINEVDAEAAANTAKGLAHDVALAAFPSAYTAKAGVNLRDFPTLKAAIAALPATGGTVTVPIGRWPSGDWNYVTDYMAKPDVRIVGEKMPHLSANADRLEGGSVIVGRFNVFADGFEITNVGVDAGKFACDALYPGLDTHAANHPLGGTWDALSFSYDNPSVPLAARRNCRFMNIIGLLRDPLTVGHAVLMQGIEDGVADNIIAVGGMHGVVVKAVTMRMGRLSGWAQSGNNVIFKADTLTPCGGLSVDHVEALTVPPGTAPWFTSLGADNGLQISPSTASFTGSVQIGSLRSMGAKTGLRIDGGAGMSVTDVQIGEVFASGQTGTMNTAIDFQTCRASRIQIGDFIATAGVTGISWAPTTAADNPYPQIHIRSAKISSMSARAISASAYSRVRIDTLDIVDTLRAYSCAGAARILIGAESLTNVTTKWELTPPALSTGWANFGGTNSTWDVKLENYGVTIKGLLIAGAGVAGGIASLPAYLRPPQDKRYTAYLNINGTRSTGLVGVDGVAGMVNLNDGTAPTVGSYISLDGIGWQHW